MLGVPLSEPRLAIGQQQPGTYQAFIEEVTVERFVLSDQRAERCPFQIGAEALAFIALCVTCGNCAGPCHSLTSALSPIAVERQCPRA